MFAPTIRNLADTVNTTPCQCLFPSATGKLNIAHHESYDPYRRDSIEFCSDEKEAREKESKEEGMMDLEAVFRNSSKEHKGKDVDLAELTAAGSMQPAVLLGIPTFSGKPLFTLVISPALLVPPPSSDVSHDIAALWSIHHILGRFQGPNAFTSPVLRPIDPHLGPSTRGYTIFAIFLNMAAQLFPGATDHDRRHLNLP
ncbi:hypothetical protein FB451DRAFT_1413961 [Mycena latifolia]|nr:hypothetical protein FB451DRAFT_1413961 [Mycena latifolia]